MPPRQRWTDAQILNFDDDESDEPRPSPAPGRGRGRGRGRRPSGVVAARPKKRANPLPSDSDGFYNDSDSLGDDLAMARDYVANLAAGAEGAAGPGPIMAGLPLGPGAAGAAFPPVVPASNLSDVAVGRVAPRSGSGHDMDKVRDASLADYDGESESGVDDLLADVPGPLGPGDEAEEGSRSGTGSDSEGGETGEAGGSDSGANDGDSADDDEEVFLATLLKRQRAAQARARGRASSGAMSDRGGGGDAVSDSGSGSLSDSEDGLETEFPTSLNKVKKKGKKGKKGGPGELLPGEKKKLRQEAIKAKRAARAAAKGFDLVTVKADLEGFVREGGDVKAFQPMGKAEVKVVQKMATLFGLRSSVQGSGKKQFLLVQSTKRATIPQGEAASEVRLLLTLQEARESAGSRGGGSLEERRALARMAGVKGISAAQAVKPAKGFRGGVPSHSRKKGRIEAAGPVAFVAAGNLPGTGDETTVVIVHRDRTLAAGAETSGSPAPRAAAAEPCIPGFHPPPGPPPAPAEVLITMGSAGAARPPGAVRRRPGPSRTVQSPGDRVAEYNRWAAAAAQDGFGVAATPSQANESGAVSILYSHMGGLGLGGEAEEAEERRGLGSGHPRDLVSLLDSGAGLGGLPFPQAYSRPEDPLDEDEASGDTMEEEEEEEVAGRRGRGLGLGAAGPSRVRGRGPGGPGERLPASLGAAFGAFEQHTTGFGSKMLLKMGFDGRGLGRRRDGIVEPIQPSMRPKRQGLGAE